MELEIRSLAWKAHIKTKYCQVLSRSSTFETSLKEMINHKSHSMFLVCKSFMKLYLQPRTAIMIFFDKRLCMIYEITPEILNIQYISVKNCIHPIYPLMKFWFTCKFLSFDSFFFLFWNCLIYYSSVLICRWRLNKMEYQVNCSNSINGGEIFRLLP